MFGPPPPDFRPVVTRGDASGRGRWTSKLGTFQGLASYLPRFLATLFMAMFILLGSISGVGVSRSDPRFKETFLPGHSLISATGRPCASFSGAFVPGAMCLGTWNGEDRYLLIQTPCRSAQGLADVRSVVTVELLAHLRSFTPMAPSPSKVKLAWCGWD